MAGQVLQAPAGGDGGEGEGGLGHREGVADALAGAGGEGDEGVAGRLGALGIPAVGVKGFGVGVEIGAVVDEVGAVREAGAGGEWVPAQVGVMGDCAGEEPALGVQPEGFVDDAFGQFQTGQIGVGGRVSAQDGVDLGVQPLLELGVARQGSSAQARVLAVVSVPARKTVRIVSLISASVMPRPPSSGSRASTRAESRSPWSVPSALRR